MKQSPTGLCRSAIIFVLFLRPVQAQTTEVATKAEGPSSYSSTAEVTFTGTVSSVFTKAIPGTVVGSHLLLATPSGLVDASLGRFGLLGKGAISVVAGQQIEATGVMKTIKGKTFFIVRSVKVGNELYVIRNEHGFPLSPEARERARQKADQKVESR